MQPTADFLGELFGPSWTPQGVAAVISSCIALVAVGISSRVTWRQGLSTRRHVDEVDHRQAEREREYKGRDQWWERFTWAAGELASEDEERIGIGLTVLSDLSTMSWASESDKVLVAEILRQVLIANSDEGEEAEQYEDNAEG